MIFLKRKIIIFLLIISIIFNNFLFFDYYNSDIGNKNGYYEQIVYAQGADIQNIDSNPQQQSQAKVEGCGVGWKVWRYFTSRDTFGCLILQIPVFVAWLIAEGLRYLNYVVAWIVDYLSSLNPFDEKDRFAALNMPDPISVFWSILVNISSIFLVFFALAAAFQYLFGEDALAKRNLFYILLIALLIQFSYLFVEQAFKLTFALEKGLSGGASNQIGSIIASSFWLVNPKASLSNAAGSIVNNAFRNAGDDQSKEAGTAKAAFMELITYVGVIALQFIALMVLIALAILFVARYLMIMVLTGLAPLAITSIAVPQFKGALGNITAKFQFFDKWLSLLISWLLIIPVIVLGLLICVIIAKGFFLGASVAAQAGGGGSLIQFVLGILLTLGCNIGVFNLGLSLGGAVGGFAQKVAFGAAVGFLGAKVGGAVAKRVVFNKVGEWAGQAMQWTGKKVQGGSSRFITKTGFAYRMLGINKLASAMHAFGGKLVSGGQGWEEESKKTRAGIDNLWGRRALVEETRRTTKQIRDFERKEKAVDREFEKRISYLKENKPRGYEKKIQKLEKKREKQKQKIAEKKQSLQERAQKTLSSIVDTASVDPGLVKEIISATDKQSASYLLKEIFRNQKLAERLFSEETVLRNEELVKTLNQALFDKVPKKNIIEEIASASPEVLDSLSEITSKAMMDKVGKESFLQLLQKRASLQGSIDLPPQFRDIINDEGAGLYDNLQAGDPNKIVNSLVKIGGKAVTDLNTLFALSQQLNLQVDTIYDLLLNRIAGKEKRDFLAGAATASEEARKSLVDFLNNNPEVLGRLSAQEKALIIPLGVQMPSKTKEEKMQEPTVETSTTSASTIQQEIKKLDDPNYRQTIVNSIKITVSVKDDYLQKIFSDKNELNKFIEYGNYPDINEALISLWERVESKLTDKQINIILDGIKNNLGETKVNELHDKHWVRHWFNKATEAKKKLEEEEKDKNNNQDNNPENQNSNSDNNSNQ
ncbi:MAG: hypothetical protein KatS3mg097_310 [Candidatus Parcubacteria bacterium]|nr:MAG: hypothetical protein KatS3mg097_310 [Candidatus Parcubacteria bacterium]